MENLKGIKQKCIYYAYIDSENKEIWINNCSFLGAITGGEKGVAGLLRSICTNF